MICAHTVGLKANTKPLIYTPQHSGYCTKSALPTKLIIIYAMKLCLIQEATILLLRSAIYSSNSIIGFGMSQPFKCFDASKHLKALLS